MPRNTNGLFRDLRHTLEAAYPAMQYYRIYVVVDHYKIHKPKAVEVWIANHPRLRLHFLPTYCPRANPIERAFGDVHDCCAPNHKRKRLRDLVTNMVEHLDVNSPWQYKLSDIYDDPAVTAVGQRMDMKNTLAAGD